MRSNAPPISQLRIQRIHRWILLWLKWFAAFLAAAEQFAPLSVQANAIGHAWLDRIERGFVCLVISHASSRVRPMIPPRHSPHRRRETQQLRAIIGSALRRRLRGKTLAQRIANLSQDIESFVASVAKRLPRGMTRRRPIIARPEARTGTPPEAPPCALTQNDSS